MTTQQQSIAVKLAKATKLFWQDATEGVNMRCAVEDGKSFLAARQTQLAA